MKSKKSLVLSIGILGVTAMLFLWNAGPIFGSPEKAKNASNDSSYILVSPHTAEECLSALDAVLGETDGKQELAKWDWGCAVGDHTGYRIVTASNEQEALEIVPDGMRPKAKAIQLVKFTPEQIASYHAQSK